jgi:hypothetical protein
MGAQTYEIRPRHFRSMVEVARNAVSSAAYPWLTVGIIHVSSYTSGFCRLYLAMDKESKHNPDPSDAIAAMAEQGLEQFAKNNAAGGYASLSEKAREKVELFCTFLNQRVLGEPEFLPGTGRPTACDLFSGPGGFSEGLCQAGLHVVVANEIDPVAAKSYALNHPNTRIIVGDIRVEETKGEICRCFTNRLCDVLVGGVPCQPWSRTGKKGGFNDPRGRLWFEFSEMARRLNPIIVVAENVPGLRDHPGALETIVSEFCKLGYRVEDKILNAADYGVPQVRKRLFIIATRTDQPIIWPEPGFGPQARTSAP